MRIKVKSEEHNISLALPNALLLNRLSARIGAHYVNKASEKEILTSTQLRMLFAAIKQCKKDFPDLYLVEVDSADGEIVRIKL